jgi:hypothetical protein
MTQDFFQSVSKASPTAGGVEDMEQLERARLEQYKEYQRVLCFLGLWVIAVILAIQGSVVPPHKPFYEMPGFKSDWGYTKSLVLMYLPLAFLWYWYIKNRDELELRPVMKSVLPIIAGIALTWIVLDISLANLFFAFPNPSGHVSFLRFPGYKWTAGCDTLLTIFVPSCYSRTIPFEEAAFYIGGALIIQMLYLWAAEDFYGVYTMPRRDYERQAKKCPALIHANWKLALTGVLLFVAGVLYKKFGNHPYHDGLPWYLLAELLIVFLPLTLLYDRVKLFTNPPAFLFVMFLQIMISLIWEATFGLPLGWWNYRLKSMMGSVVGPWENLPLEACILWLSVGWASMFSYEATKIKTHSGRSWPQVLFGRNSWLP